MYYILTTLWGLTNSVAVTSLLGFASDLCTDQQLPLLFGMECFFEGIGGIALIPLSGKNFLILGYTILHFSIFKRHQ